MAALRTPSETPERLWSTGMASALAEELAHLTTQARASQVRKSDQRVEEKGMQPLWHGGSARRGAGPPQACACEGEFERLSGTQNLL